ncbi:RNA polymerase sigma factor [Clostridium cylindrosporum]|uniref:RNA polymerase sigma factor, sigma-70 family n=1 Tax=Clostridium cylindrosporum DSM 605 TaxID=1121307 RepID=A0A0J8DBZ8_CLOCY|nr:sigma-70 family RNA polymerase sigma factor [Clostridium cylindrosporum]KMT21824.1 RNA polymerase sigma factor, sigma-70 family [Clostridium cylindrosporum DSM 605]
MESTAFEINDIIEIALTKYSDMVRRICFLYLNNSTDVDDIFQEVFLKMLQRKTPFESDKHEKAWLIRVTINKCKDTLKSFWRKNIDSIEGIDIPFEDKSENELMQIVLSIPQKYKDVIYLHYYEGYTVPEMAKLLKKRENTIYSQLHRARLIIRQKLGGKEHEYAF